jgi:hypothetical protein
VGVAEKAATVVVAVLVVLVVVALDTLAALAVVAEVAVAWAVLAVAVAEEWGCQLRQWKLLRQGGDVGGDGSY